MSDNSQTSSIWALVLAGGQGSRLQGLTQDGQGTTVPKQFCSLKGGPSLLQEALQRAAAVAELPRLCTIVTEEHRQWWTPVLSSLPARNVIVQPQNRGTAFGILLPLVRIAERDPDATVVLLPADHYVRDEHVMAASLRRAAKLAASDRERIYLLGVEPDEPDTGLGYILPKSRSRDMAVPVAQFVEKPTENRARLLLEQGALWNIFILAGSVNALLGLFDRSYATTIAAMRDSGGASIATVYQNISSLDFSHDVLQGKESLLKVLAVPHCGWTDLGTPRSIGLTLERLQGGLDAASYVKFGAPVNLADRFVRARAPADARRV